jgi:hypothetical protein
MRQKGVFPYDFFDGITQLQCTDLPSRAAFYNKLNGDECTEEQYEHVKNVWRTFNCQSFRDYHDLYLKSDVLLLADFFEKFRRLCLESYGLDALHYYTVPGMAWDAALKMTEIELDLIGDEEIYTFLERSIRGGISQISKRIGKANNTYANGSVDPLAPITYLIYLDANNLYGWAMSQPLPTRNFRWLTPEEIEQLDLSVIADNTRLGYIFEVDLKYPHELHERHSDYPLAPERLDIEEEMLSPFQKRCFPKD